MIESLNVDDVITYEKYNQFNTIVIRRFDEATTSYINLHELQCWVNDVNIMITSGITGYFANWSNKEVPLNPLFGTRSVDPYLFNVIIEVNPDYGAHMSLTNFDLHRLCKQMDLPIVGVFSKDELEPIPQQIGTSYINMSDAHEAGTHFVCFKIVCDEDRDNYKGKKNKNKVCEAIYFDSIGIDMPIEVANSLKNFRPIAYSNRHIQNIHSDVCGWYCLLFDYALEHKQMDDTYVEDFERFLNNWSDNTITNTKLLKSIFKGIP